MLISESVVADKGFNGKGEIEACVMNGIVPYVGFKYDKEERLYMLDYVKADITKKQRQSTEPEDISTCLHAGILPSCYENINISVEVCTDRHKTDVGKSHSIAVMLND